MYQVQVHETPQPIPLANNFNDSVDKDIIKNETEVEKITPEKKIPDMLEEQATKSRTSKSSKEGSIGNNSKRRDLSDTMDYDSWGKYADVSFPSCGSKELSHNYDDWGNMTSNSNSSIPKVNAQEFNVLEKITKKNIQTMPGSGQF